MPVVGHEMPLGFPSFLPTYQSCLVFGYFMEDKKSQNAKVVPTTNQSANAHAVISNQSFVLAVFKFYPFLDFVPATFLHLLDIILSGYGSEVLAFISFLFRQSMIASSTTKRLRYLYCGLDPAGLSWHVYSFYFFSSIFGWTLIQFMASLGWAYCSLFNLPTNCCLLSYGHIIFQWTCTVASSSGLQPEWKENSLTPTDGRWQTLIKRITLEPSYCSSLPFPRGVCTVPRVSFWMPYNFPVSRLFQTPKYKRRSSLVILLQTTNCGLRLTVSRYPSAHIWDLRFAGGSLRRPLLVMWLQKPMVIGSCGHR